MSYADEDEVPQQNVGEDGGTESSQRNIPAKKKRVVKVTPKAMSKRTPTKQAITRTFFLTEPTSPLRKERKAKKVKGISVSFGLVGNHSPLLSAKRIAYNPPSVAPGAASGFSKSMVRNRLMFEGTVGPRPKSPRVPCTASNRIKLSLNAAPSLLDPGKFNIRGSNGIDSGK